jgi:hypothetical protein
MEYNKNITVPVRVATSLLLVGTILASTQSYPCSSGFTDPSSLKDDIFEDIQGD